MIILDDINYEYLGIMYISKILKNEGHIVKLHILGESIKDIINFKPDFIMYSLITGNHQKFIDYNKKLKKLLNFTSIFGGPHPTYFPEMIDIEGIDYILRGEGENSILNILKRPKDRVIIGELPENIDNIPFPDRDLLYFIPKHKNNPIKHFISSRGCPYNCSYCYNSIWRKIYKDKKTVRYRSPENIIKEIKEVISKYPTKLIYFQDDCFDANKKWLYKFLDLYKKNFKLSFHCIIRLDILDEETTKKLSESGCISVRCAAEAGNDYLRNKILNRNMTKEDIINGTKLLRKYNIYFVLQNMIGLPESNLKRDMETLLLNIKCRPTLGWCSIFQPYPMTEIGKTFSIDVNNFKPSFYEESVINIPHKKEVKKLQKLFGFITKYPIFYILTPILIKLPLDKIYIKIWLYTNKKADKKLYRGII